MGTIDCGSFTSCISMEMHRKLGKKSKRIEPMKVESAKGKLQIKEKIWLKVNFGKYTAKIPFSIIDDPNYQSNLIIIGSDFLKQTDCTIKLAQKSLWIEDKYHVRFYTDKKQITYKLEQIKNAMTKQTAKRDGETKPKKVLRETKQNPSERVSRGEKRNLKKGTGRKAQ